MMHSATFSTIAVEPVRFANGSNLGCQQSAVTSLSLRIAELLAIPALQARVESAFPAACNLVTENGLRFSLVAERIGNGPLHAVLAPAHMLSRINAGDTLTGDGRWLTVERAGRVDLRPARLWNPSPDYAGLATRPRAVRATIARLRAWLPCEAPPASLAAPSTLPARQASPNSPAAAFAQARARQLIDGLLAAYRHHSLAGIERTAQRLAGLGPGLTPAGDDWLGGWLVGLRSRAELTSDIPARLPLPLAVVCQTVIGAADGRTTGLSLAFLRAAADGAVPQAWHGFLQTLPDADLGLTYRAAQQIMRHGATSGADMLAGFLAAFS